MYIYILAAGSGYQTSSNLHLHILFLSFFSLLDSSLYPVIQLSHLSTGCSYHCRFRIVAPSLLSHPIYLCHLPVYLPTFLPAQLPPNQSILSTYNPVSHTRLSMFAGYEIF